MEYYQQTDYVIPSLEQRLYIYNLILDMYLINGSNMAIGGLCGKIMQGYCSTGRYPSLICTILEGLIQDHFPEFIAQKPHPSISIGEYWWPQHDTTSRIVALRKCISILEEQLKQQ